MCFERFKQTAYFADSHLFIGVSLRSQCRICPAFKPYDNNAVALFFRGLGGKSGKGTSSGDDGDGGRHSEALSGSLSAANAALGFTHKLQKMLDFRALSAILGRLLKRMAHRQL